MQGIQNALPLAAGAGGGFELGQAAGNIVNYVASVPVEIAPDVKMMVVAVVVPAVALAAHWLMSLDLDHDGKPDVSPPSA